MLAKYTFWPFLEDSDDVEYGPIREDTIAVVVAESSATASALLPEAPAGCYFDLVGIEPQ